MTLLVRGESTALAGIPRHWHPPFPDPFVTRMLKPKGSFYKKIPLSLLKGDAPDLGVMVWALLRLSFDGQANVGSYRRFAKCLNLDHLSDTALDKRFGLALRPLIGIWIIRKRLPDNSYLYKAVLPDATADERYAILRPSDIELLEVAPPKGIDSIAVSDLVDFCRWQLECGRRGWTIDPLRNIAERWGVTHPTMKRSRDRLAKIGLLKVVPRTGGRLSDLIWLEELYDPHWQVPTTRPGQLTQSHVVRAMNQQEEEEQVWKADGRLCGNPTTVSVEDEERVDQKAHGRSFGSWTTGPIGSSTGYSTEDETDLGGASAPPLRFVTREMADAPPAASRMKEDPSDARSNDSLQVSARLVSQHSVFAKAKPHFRRAAIARLATALERGLEPGHADRALARVAEEGAFDAELLLLRRALQQARADQLAGMCAECGGDRRVHNRGCAEFADTWDDRSLVRESGWRPKEPSPVADPLTILLQRPVPAESELADETLMVEWLIVQLARQLVDVSDREVRLRAIARGMRAKAPPGQRELVDQAAEHVRYALSRSLAS